MMPDKVLCVNCPFFYSCTSHVPESNCLSMLRDAGYV